MKKSLLLFALCCLPFLGICGGKIIKINSIGGDKAAPAYIFHTGEIEGAKENAVQYILITEADYSNLCDIILKTHTSYFSQSCTSTDFSAAYSIAVSEEQKLVLMVPPFGRNCAKDYFNYLISESKKTNSKKALIKGLSGLVSSI
ncbi:hypothetical protein [Pontibacter sp. SGAir0037]|uniref:hypothetical protein n=1 Tax=Pontibacter sp. SGAir0037 TaxID=2571030 RepID=UPI0010CCDA54|nr:hypothetical protein [Pontibacter sp. SGAir0037]QCR21992.1 hypothetical protein C1N53_06335 [Pontibacter sp. SGAir0037]